MSGKVIGIVLVLCAAIGGGAMYYLQVYGFYEEVQPDEISLVSVITNAPEPIVVENMQAIDAESSPIRFRACFDTPHSLAMLTETYEVLETVPPRNAPHWFECFDAQEIAAELDAGTALVFLGEKNIGFGVDRVVVITEDGRGYAWHDLNNCGEKAYDGSIIGEECPPRPTDQD